jgi:6-pyruvoyl-tetrahydropterin synthase
MTHKEKNEKAKQLIHDICGFFVSDQVENRKKFIDCFPSPKQKYEDEYICNAYTISVRYDLATKFAELYRNDLNAFKQNFVMMHRPILEEMKQVFQDSLDNNMPLAQEAIDEADNTITEIENHLSSAFDFAAEREKDIDKLLEAMKE